ncbi:MAG: outer membrane lipoprotein-sorting protein [Myxococcota bacterium]
MRARSRSFAADAAVVLLLALAGPALADPPATPQRLLLETSRTREAPPLEDALPEGHALSGKEIYERVLRNRFDAYVQTSSLVSGDRGGSEQESRLSMSWKSYRDEDDQPTRGILSKTLVKYTHPFDLRFSGYLIVSNHQRHNDQFVYLASTRRVRRVNLRGEAVFGTDFTFEDVVPREVEDSTYRRMPDAEVDGVPCFVVEVTPRAHADSDYSKFVVYVEKEHYVPLRTRYWDDRDLEVKELRAQHDSIQDFGGIFVPLHTTMRNLQLDTYTSLEVQSLEPNPKLRPTDFDLRRLESH